MVLNGDGNYSEYRPNTTPIDYTTLKLKSKLSSSSSPIIYLILQEKSIYRRIDDWAIRTATSVTELEDTLDVESGYWDESPQERTYKKKYFFNTNHSKIKNTD